MAFPSRIKHDETVNFTEADTIFFDITFNLSSELVWVGTSEAYSLTFMAAVARARGFPVETFKKKINPT